MKRRVCGMRIASMESLSSQLNIKKDYGDYL